MCVADEARAGGGEEDFLQEVEGDGGEAEELAGVGGGEADVGDGVGGEVVGAEGKIFCLGGMVLVARNRIGLGSRRGEAYCPAAEYDTRVPRARRVWWNGVNGFGN